MGNDLTDTDKLAAEHEYLAQEHRHHNWLIHGTWYLDIILIAGGIQAYNELEAYRIHGAIFSFFVFLGLGTYTMFQLDARRHVKVRKRRLAKILGYGSLNGSKEYNGFGAIDVPCSINSIKAGALLFFFYLIPCLLSLFLFLTHVLGLENLLSYLSLSF